jgi:hypothetical protein
MRKLLLAAAVVLVAAPALAGTMDSTYGNTVLVTNAKGEVTTLLLEADGTYVAKGKDEKGADVTVKGKWEIRDGKYCATPDAVEGQPAPKESCTEYVDGKNVGDKWDQKGIEGEAITVEITQGRS